MRQYLYFCTSKASTFALVKQAIEQGGEGESTSGAGQEAERESHALFPRFSVRELALILNAYARAGFAAEYPAGTFAQVKQVLLH